MSDNGSAIFQPVAPGRVSKEIVAQVKQALRDGSLSPGDRLPPERELTETFGVSRVTVRDALRILEAHGLVEIRVGAGGGAFVTAPVPGHIAEGISNMLLMSATTPQEVTETRMILEVGMLVTVCERANDDDIAALTAICDRAEAALKAGSHDIRLSAEFHIRLARSTHNRAIELLTDSLQEPLLHSLAEAKHLSPEMGRPGVSEHRKIVNAIADRDPDRAKRVMQPHLARTAKRLRKAQQRTA